MWRLTSDRRECLDNRLAGSGAVLALAFAACGTSEPEATTVWAVDCVAISGAMQLTALTLLDSVPYTGLPRDKFIGDLSDMEVRRLCDFQSCRVVRWTMAIDSYATRTGRSRFGLRRIRSSRTQQFRAILRLHTMWVSTP